VKNEKKGPSLFFFEIPLYLQKSLFLIFVGFIYGQYTVRFSPPLMASNVSADTEFFIILPRAKNENLLASA
jgi:hypothetical protein